MSSPESQSVDDPKVEVFKPGWRLLAAICSLGIVNLACALDATSIAIALPTISNALHGTSIQAFWTGTAFLLASTVWQPTFVSFSHVFGRRPILIFALILFTVGSILCGVSHNMTIMLAGRVVQGSGVGGIMTLTETLITDMVPLRQRGNYVALISIVWAIGTVAGPFLGGVLAQEDAWRWIFWLNLPILAIGFVGVVVFLNLKPSEGSLKEKLVKIDYLGCFLFVTSITSFLISISWGGVMYKWSSWHTLVPMLLGAAGLIGFYIYESFFANFPLLPLKLFHNSTTIITYFVTFLHGVVLWSMVYYLPIYFLSVFWYTPIIAGVAGLPQTLTVVPSAMVVGLVATKTGRYRWGIWTGWALSTLGCGIMCLLNTNTFIPRWVFLLLIPGVGLGLLFPSMNLSVQASVLPEHVGTAAGLFPFFRALGQTVGVAVGGVVFQNRMQHELRAYPELAKYASDAVALIEQMRMSPFDAPQNVLLRLAFANSTRIIWAVMTGLAGVALMSSIFIEGFDLNRALVTDQGFIDAAKRGDSEEAGENGPSPDVEAVHSDSTGHLELKYL